MSMLQRMFLQKFKLFSQPRLFVCAHVQVFAYSGAFAPAWLDRNAWFIPVEVPPEHVEKLPVSKYAVFDSLGCDLL